MREHALGGGAKAIRDGPAQAAADQPVSRAWDFIFRVAMSRIERQASDYYRSPQAKPPSVAPSTLYIELPDRNRDESREVVRAVNAATAAANALSADAAAACKREHEELARDRGLDRPATGFR
jgi:hypothetical protein